MFHIIFNPVAGKKKASKNMQIATRILDEHGVAYEVHGSGSVRDAENITRELSLNGEKEFVVIGGDGTLNEVLNGLVDPSQSRLGLIPSGTGNDFAEKLGIPFDAEEATNLILNGETKETDYIEINGTRRSMNVAGIGMDVDVLERCQKGKMKGKLKYLKSLIQSLFAFKGYPVEIVTDDRVEKRSVLLGAVCNGAQFGGGIKICPTASVDDGKMDVVLVDCIGGKWKIIKAFLKLLKGKILEYPATTHFLCNQVRFAPEKVPFTMQLDGELMVAEKFEAKLCRGLKFFR